MARRKERKSGEIPGRERQNTMQKEIPGEKDGTAVIFRRTRRRFVNDTENVQKRYRKYRMMA